MGVTECVRQDHRILRAKLRLLEAAMQVAPEAQFVLREMCWSLARMLDAHITHENEVLEPYSNRIKALTKERMAQEHADQRVVLRDVNTLLLGGLKTPVSAVVPPLAHLIEELRAHMAQEEGELFPLVDRIAAEQSPTLTAPPPFTTPQITDTIPPPVCRPGGPATSDKSVASPSASRQVVGTMTVNGAIRAYPGTRCLFERWCVNIPYEGCDGLDEVAWHHSMDIATLLRELNETAGRQAVTES